jgi:hypothetical protein
MAASCDCWPAALRGVLAAVQIIAAALSLFGLYLRRDPGQIQTFNKASLQQRGRLVFGGIDRMSRCGSSGCRA